VQSDTIAHLLDRAVAAPRLLTIRRMPPAEPSEPKPKTRDLHPMAGSEAAAGHACLHNWRAGLPWRLQSPRPSS
jgi:hypothetical protein